MQLSEPKKGFFRGKLESSFEEGLFPVSYCVSEAEWDQVKAATAVEDEVLMVCKCLVDFSAPPGSLDLSFKASDRVSIIDMSSATVWKARLKGKVGSVNPQHVEEDKGFTIRRATAQKQASRDQFANRRKKESSNLEKNKGDSSRDLNHLKKEQELLQKERDEIQRTKEERKNARVKRDSGSFQDRLKARSDSKKLEAEAKNRAEREQEKKEKTSAAVSAWMGGE